MIGIKSATLNRIESGETKGFEKYRAKLAKALNCSPEELDGDDIDLPTIPVTMIIRHKTFVQHLPEKEIEQIEQIPGLPETAEALKIKTHELTNYHRRNDALFFDSVPTKKEDQFLDRECIVHIDEVHRGEWLLAWVSKSRTKGHYHLHIHNAPVMTDVKILAAHPIIYIKRA